MPIRLRADEAGFGMVEVMVAALLIGLGIVGTMGALEGADKGSYSAQRSEQAISVAQKEIEKIAAYPFANVELDSLPTAVSDPNPNNPADPRAFISGSNLLIKRNYHDSAAGAPTDNAASEPMVVDSNPANDSYSIPPLTQNVPVGPPSATGVQPTATIWRFVTRRDENCQVLGVPLADLCPAEAGTRRVTVAVSLNSNGPGSAGAKTPVYLATTVTDRSAAPLDLDLSALGL